MTIRGRMAVIPKRETEMNDRLNNEAEKLKARTTARAMQIVIRMAFLSISVLAIESSFASSARRRFLRPENIESPTKDRSVKTAILFTPQSASTKGELNEAPINVRDSRTIPKTTDIRTRYRSPLWPLAPNKTERRSTKNDLTVCSQKIYTNAAYVRKTKAPLIFPFTSNLKMRDPTNMTNRLSVMRNTNQRPPVRHSSK